MDTNPTGIVREPWGVAIAKGVGMFLVSVLLLVILPDRLVTYLATRTTPTRRDLAVVAVWAVSFVLCCWGFVRIQPREGRR
jgi:hypothetical protein